MPVSQQDTIHKLLEYVIDKLDYNWASLIWLKHVANIKTFSKDIAQPYTYFSKPTSTYDIGLHTKKKRVAQGFFGKGDGSMWNHTDPKNPLSPSMVICNSNKGSVVLCYYMLCMTMASDVSCERLTYGLVSIEIG